MLPRILLSMLSLSTDVISDLINPGATALTVIDLDAYSLAVDLVSAITPPLAAA